MTLVQQLARFATEATYDQISEEADHSLPYMVAIALLDDQVLPAQYEPGRIRSADVQDLLRTVEVRPASEYSERFPERMPADVRIHADGRVHVVHKEDYEGFHSRPMSWETVSEKFGRLAAPYTEPGLREEVRETVRHLEEVQVADLMGLLGRIETPD